MPLVSYNFKKKTTTVTAYMKRRDTTLSHLLYVLKDKCITTGGWSFFQGRIDLGE